MWAEAKDIRPPGPRSTTTTLAPFKLNRSLADHCSLDAQASSLRGSLAELRGECVPRPVATHTAAVCDFLWSLSQVPICSYSCRRTKLYITGNHADARFCAHSFTHSFTHSQQLTLPHLFCLKNSNTHVCLAASGNFWRHVSNQRATWTGVPLVRARSPHPPPSHLPPHTRARHHHHHLFRRMPTLDTKNERDSMHTL